MSEISIEILFYQRKFLWKLAWFELDTQFISNIRSCCTYLLFSIEIIYKDLFLFVLSLTSNDFYNIHFLEALKHRLLKKKIKITHNNNLTSNQQNNHSKSISKFSIFRFVTFSVLSRNLFASFRFVNVSTICLRQWHSMSSLQRLVNLLQWNS